MHWIFLSIWLLALSGCASAAPPSLVNLTSLAPDTVEPGDRLQLTGTGFPEGRPATVTLEGTIYRAGLPELSGFRETFEGVNVLPTSVEMVLSRELEQSLCGVTPRAVHATFKGHVLLAFAPKVAGAPPISGRLANVTLEVFPALPASSAGAVPEASALMAQEAARFLDFAGFTTERLARGLRVTSVAPGSRAEAAGLLVDDIIATVGGVTAVTNVDLVPSSEVLRTPLLVTRGALAEPLTLILAVEGFSKTLADNYTWAFAVLAALALALLFLASPWSRLLGYLLVDVANAPVLSLRASSQGSSRTPGARSSLGVLVIVSLLFSWCVVYRPSVSSSSLVILLLLVSALLRLCLIFSAAGRAAAVDSGFSLRGALLETTLYLVCEFLALLGLLPTLMRSGGLGFEAAALQQGGWPWQWAAFSSIAGALGLILFSAALLCSPFGASSDACRLNSAFQREKAGSSWPLALTIDWILIVVRVGLLVGLFLGGAQAWGTASSKATVTPLELVIFELKYLAVLIVLRKARDLAQAPCFSEFVPKVFPRLLLPCALLLGLSLVLPSLETHKAHHFIEKIVGPVFFLASLLLIALLCLPRKDARFLRHTQVSPWL